MIEFMVLALPRCATTWVANWLTTDATLCKHDPLWQTHHEDLDTLVSTKRLGVSCTGLWLFPEWVNSHPARKVILHRELSEINASLSAIGLPAVSQDEADSLWQLEGLHAPHTDVFDPITARRIHEFLTDLPFDSERHAELAGIEMQPDFLGLTINREVTRKLLGELRRI